MHRILQLHADALKGAGTGGAPRPAPPSDFILSWLRAVMPWATEGHGTELVAHYGRGSIIEWMQRFHGSPEPVRELLRLDLRTAHTPRLHAALERLFEGAREAGLPTLFGVDGAAALLGAAPRVIDLHVRTFYGCCQPMVSLGTVEQQEIVRSVAAGWTPEQLLDARLAGHVMHELSHGAARTWRGGPASWMVMEAAGAVVNLGCDPAHVLVERPGEPVLGLRNALVLGSAMVRSLGKEAVWRLALVSETPSDEVGRRSANAMTAVDWQRWTSVRRSAFMPIQERMLAWAKLFDISRQPELLPELDALERAEVVTPDLALGLPDLLELAEAVPWSKLEVWRRRPDAWDREALEWAIHALFQIERLQPDVVAVPSDPPGGRLVLEVTRCALQAERRLDDVHKEPVSWRMPPALCRVLFERGCERVEIRGACWERRGQVVRRLVDLCEGVGSLPPGVVIDLIARPRDALPPLSTEVVIPPAPAQLHHTDAVVTLGSCFATHIGGRLAHALFEVHDNPFGILYDPMSVGRALSWVCRDEPLPEDLVFSAHGRWHSPWHHTDLSGDDPATVRAGLDRRLSEARAARGRHGVWLLTWGTAWVWTSVATGEIVANCHGLPAELYSMRSLSVSEVVARYEQLLVELPARVHLVLTVSPIRHLAQGVTGNQRSKATLHLAATELAERHERIHYFPAYEIVLDELRDYRWYEADMVHIAPEAADRVYERFLEAWVAPASRRLARDVARIHQGLVEVPRDPLRRVRVIEQLEAELELLPASPALPRAHQLGVQLRLAREAALGQLGRDAEDLVEVRVQLPMRVADRAMNVVEPAPAVAASPVADLTRAQDALATVLECLGPGAYVAWDAQEAWADTVAEAVGGLVAVGGDNHPAWEALEALMLKASEVADATLVLPRLAEPLVAEVLQRAGAPGSRVDTVHALHELFMRQVPRGHVEAGEATFGRARSTELAALVELLDSELAARQEAGRRPHTQLVALRERMVAAQG